jgi:hypothetical protein
MRTHVFLPHVFLPGVSAEVLPGTCKHHHLDFLRDAASTPGCEAPGSLVGFLVNRQPDGVAGRNSVSRSLATGPFHQTQSSPCSNHRAPAGWHRAAHPTDYTLQDNSTDDPPDHPTDNSTDSSTDSSLRAAAPTRSDFPARKGLRLGRTPVSQGRRKRLAQRSVFSFWSLGFLRSFAQRRCTGVEIGCNPADTIKLGFIRYGLLGLARPRNPGSHPYGGHALVSLNRKYRHAAEQLRGDMASTDKTDN